MQKIMSFYMELESLMGSRIDLVDEEFIRNKYFREELDETKQLIYG
jgi:predicted nucleotidyltransferase